MADQEQTPAVVAEPAAVDVAAKAAEKPAAKPAPKARPQAAKAPAEAAVAGKAPVRRKHGAKKGAAKDEPLTPDAAAHKAALAKALAAAQAVKITSPLGKPGKGAKAEKPAKPKKAEKPEKMDKAKKPKLVRDSFTMPDHEYRQLAELKKRLLDSGKPAKKSELLRAGIALLAALADRELVAALARVEKVKTGRPAKS